MPWLAAGMPGTPRAASAPNTASTIRWLVSTLPPATGAGWRGWTRQPSGAVTRMVASRPSLIGTSGSRQHAAYSTAERVTANGALRPTATSAAVPVKSTASPLGSIRTVAVIASGGSPAVVSSASVNVAVPCGSSAQRACARPWLQSSSAWTWRSVPGAVRSIAASRAAPRRWAASWAWRSLQRASGVRELAATMRQTSTTGRPRLTSRTGGTTRPSPNRSAASGSEPAAIPPTSAWWARLARNAAGGADAAPSGANTGLTIVRSGRWLPPR